MGEKVRDLLECTKSEGSVNFFEKTMSDKDKIALESALKTAVTLNKELSKKKKNRNEHE